MKTRANFYLPFLFCFITLLNLRMQAQTPTDLSMHPVLDRVTEYINELEAKGDYEIVHFQCDIASPFIQREIYRNLSSGWTYSFATVTDDRIKRIRVEIETLDGESVPLTISEDGTELSSSVSFQCEETALYRILVIAEEMTGDLSSGHYGLIIYHENPYLLEERQENTVAK
jgi:hypothetical protein